jgi:hypothetical protein
MKMSKLNKSKTIEINTEEDAKFYLSELMVELMETVDDNFICKLSDDAKEVLLDAMEKEPFVLEIADMIEKSL